MAEYSKKRGRRSTGAILLSAAMAGMGISTSAAGQTVASWLGGDGLWISPTRWSTNPYSPNNGNPAGATYDAIINAPGQYVVSIDSPVSINSLTIDSPSVTFRQVPVGGGSAGFSASTITVNSGTFEALSGALVHDTTLRGSGGKFVFTDAILKNVTNEGTILIPSSSYLDQPTLTNTGTVLIDGALSLDKGWTNPGVLWLNQGELYIRLATGSTSNAGTIGGNGTIRVSGTWTPADLGTLNRTGGYVVLSGTVNNAGETLHVDNIGTWMLSFAMINGGTIASQPGSHPIVTGTVSSTINGSVLAADIDLPDDNSLYISGGLQLANSTITVGKISRLIFQGGQTLSGTGELRLNSPENWPTIAITGSLTVGPGITIRTGASGGTVGTAGNTLINRGLISAQGNEIQLAGTFDNQGMVQAISGGTFTLPAIANVLNYSAGTLNGGTWSVGANSTLSLGSSTILTNNAAILLDGVGSNFGPLTVLRTNQGYFSIRNGRNFNTGTILTNTGSIYIGQQSKLTVQAGVGNASGLIDLNGELAVDYNGPTPPNILVTQIGSHIISSDAAANPSLRIGYYDEPLPTVFHMKLVFGGDSNFDNMVDVQDLYAMAAHWQAAGNWIDGDFNYDHHIDVADLTILASNWQAGASGSGPALGTALESLGLPSVEVPEPTAFSILAFSVFGLLPRRRHGAAATTASRVR